MGSKMANLDCTDFNMNGLSFVRASALFAASAYRPSTAISYRAEGRGMRMRWPFVSNTKIVQRLGHLERQRYGVTAGTGVFDRHCCEFINAVTVDPKIA